MNKLSLVAAEKKPRFPPWLHIHLPQEDEIFQTTAILRKYGLNTVCEEAKCPNRAECFTKKTATFLALGKACTRNCGFCDIDFSKTPKAPSPEEPKNIASSVRELGLSHVVITMVARDDLPDQGAQHIANIVAAVREENPKSTIELLTSDFSGDTTLLQIVLEASFEIFNHNLETVPSLSSRVRHRATYERSCHVLAFAKKAKPDRFVKSGLMLGLGETPQEVEDTLKDLHKIGCDIVTLGQYLQPSSKKLRVKEFIPPEQFAHYQKFGESLGIRHVYAGPFVRSSYNAKLFVPGFSHAIES